MLVSSLISVLEYSNKQSSHLEHKLSYVGNVIVSLYENLSVTGSESYYDLPSMELMLECLMHLLARSQWSINLNHGEKTCMQIFNWLTQVITVL